MSQTAIVTTRGSATGSTTLHDSQHRRSSVFAPERPSNGASSVDEESVVRVIVSRAFREHIWSFDDRCPEELAPVLPKEEWQAIMERINGDLNRPILAINRTVDRWVRGVTVATACAVGILAWPFIGLLFRRRARVIRQYWHDVRKYLAHLNAAEAQRGRRLNWVMEVDVDKRDDERQAVIVRDYCRLLTVEWSR